jgi:DNA topoisomerase-3
VVLERNWLDVYNNWERWVESTLPHFQVDQLFTPTRLTLEEGQTRPPPLLSESDLIKVRRLGHCAPALSRMHGSD